MLAHERNLPTNTGYHAQTATAALGEKCGAHDSFSWSSGAVHLGLINQRAFRQFALPAESTARNRERATETRKGFEGRLQPMLLPCT